MSLDKAILQALKDRGSETDGEPIAVQFNPASLRIQLQNNVDGGRTQTRQVEQHTGTSSATLALDLHFDSADEGTTDKPVNVRSKTAAVARFVLPQPGPDKHAPPRVRFQWGELIFDGVMTSFSEDLDLFSAGGVPLRAKVSVSISGQNPAFESLATGPGAAKGAGASAPGGGALGFGAGAGLGVSAGFGAALGGGAVGFPQLTLGGGVAGGLSLGAGGFGTPRVGVALAGESPSAFAARMGLDPAAWRVLAAPGGVGLSLDAGTEVAFPKGAGTAPGVGTARGSAEPAGKSALEGVVGGGSTGGASAAAAGFALSAAGGVDAAVQTVRQAHADAASAAERRAFGLAGEPATTAAAPASRPPRADQRATSFGLGVPLRPRRGDLAGGPAVLGRRAPAVRPAPPAPRHGPGTDCGCGCGGGA